MNRNIVTKRYTISGVVQGVGFRPFLFRLANEYKLAGEVFNTPGGVTIILEGPGEDIDNCCRDIPIKKPPLALIDEITWIQDSFAGYKGFGITPSTRECPSVSALVPPDVSVCSHCLREMNDPHDRRFGYPFINCTNCGPRYTIIKDMPYDRPGTSMAPFTMCKACRQEYDDPGDRRFHAQPNACPGCGPSLYFFEPSTRIIESPDRIIESPDHVIEPPDIDAPSFPVHGGVCTVEDAISRAGEFLRQGKIVAVKGLGGFHLAVDALNPLAMAELRKRKKRPGKPLALMAASVEAVRELVTVSDLEKKAMEHHARPIVLLPKRTNPHNVRLNEIQHAIAPDNSHIGVMLPYTPLHHLLLDSGPSLLVMTSGNRTGEPISIDNSDALEAFSHIADGFLLHNRDIHFRADDSIVKVIHGFSGKREKFFSFSSIGHGNSGEEPVLSGEEPVLSGEEPVLSGEEPVLSGEEPVLSGEEPVLSFIRRSRGYAPLPLYLAQYMSEPVLACGGGLKSTICLAKENMAFLSPHIGDLDNEKVFAFYKNTIDHLQKILDIRPGIIACDLHPGYMSTAWAEWLADQGVHGNTAYQGIHGKPSDQRIHRKTTHQVSHGKKAFHLFAVQHHHAHALSCMAENGLRGDTIAVTLDGTGLGRDGCIWGGEVLLCRERGFKRMAHLKYIPMPGGDAAVHEPWRMAISILYACFGDDLLSLDLPLIRELGRDKAEFIIDMIKKNINTPMTSSCGRLFDAGASLLSLCHRASFEGQAAMALEACAAQAFYPGNSLENKPAPGRGKSLLTDIPFELSKTHDTDPEALFEINPLPMMEKIIKSIVEGESPYHGAAMFHRGIVGMFTEAVIEIAKETMIRQVVLTGGVFYNGLVLAGMIQALEREGMKVYIHKKVPCGDGGIALGQAVAAHARFQEL
ncbi:MAG: carbamoyltransferase HypF [Desulfamplus sp.]|nr:carbamoyltransferase HypF [Desulfamplus sp.]